MWYTIMSFDTYNSDIDAEKSCPVIHKSFMDIPQKNDVMIKFLNVTVAAAASDKKKI